MNENTEDKKTVDDADIAKMTDAKDNADSNSVLPDDGSLEAVLADAIETAPSAETEAGADAVDDIDPYDQLLAERDALKDQLLRALAESENTRRRSERDVQAAKKYGHTGLARDLVGAIDNLARALDIMKDDDFETGSLSEAMSNVLTGIELSWTEIMSITEKHGIKQINPAGEKFDYNFHQAMFEVPTAETPPGMVVEVLQHGYVLHDRLLRPAMVGVSKAVDAANSDAAKTDGGDDKGNGES
ncbi:nucleotide exchange factor GrpE [Alphaproteobacteria bacterium]|nr:nucleotide exchange factor GrpE [Alphaproteobacteria bacterium]